jgi:hypothetical protein
MNGGLGGDYGLWPQSEMERVGGGVIVAQQSGTGLWRRRTRNVNSAGEPVSQATSRLLRRGGPSHDKRYRWRAQRRNQERTSLGQKRTEMIAISKGPDLLGSLHLP